MKILVSDCAHLDTILPVALNNHIGIEVQEYCNPDHIDNNGHLAKRIGDKIQPIPLRGFHGPFSELVPASRDKKIQAITRSRFQDAYELAQIVEAQHLILHSGYIPKTYPREDWIKNSVVFWKDFLADKQRNIRVHLENVYEDDYSLLSELVDTINEAFQEAVLTVCLDIGHVHANSSKTLQEWINGLGPKIQYVHVHNNNGVFDDHFGLWNGTIDIEHVLDLLMRHSPEAIWTVETIHTDIEQSVIWLKEKGYIS